ncbi:MAG TPA: Xaa-Pro peptidase family protein [Rubricoccaceae bacterium]
MTNRLDQIRALAAAASCDATLVTNGPDIAWTIGFTGSSGVLVVTEMAAHLVTDGRYTTQAAEEVVGAEVHITPSALPAAVGTLGLLGASLQAVVQGDTLSVSSLVRYDEACPGTTFVPVEAFLAEARASKTEAEITAVGRAQALTCEILVSVLPLIRAGVQEHEIAAELVVRHLRAGCSAMSFEPIVASGARGALPHARPSDKAIETGDLVVIDVGGVLGGFCSDLTRTIAVGEPGDEARRAYAAVGQAQTAGIAAIRAGVSGASADAAARVVLEAAGLGEAFSHSLGHGVGSEVHEWPRLSGQADHVLPLGATVTVEPGVYLPGRFGIRTEDVVVVRADGADNLTPLSAELVVL